MSIFQIEQYFQNDHNHIMGLFIIVMITLEIKCTVLIFRICIAIRSKFALMMKILLIFGSGIKSDTK